MAVRIPVELGFVDAAQEVEVERVGNTLVLRRIEQQTLADVGKFLSMFSPDFMAQGREFHDERERDWTGLPPKLEGPSSFRVEFDCENPS